jgi:hypothetical protein
MLGSEQEVILNPGRQGLFTELAPIYALYREFKNSSSAYHRLLCLFKVMEGILVVLRKKGLEEAKALGIPFSMPKERVPDHPDIAKHLRYLIGKPIKEFCDNILEKRYRDAASHFLVQENVILQVNSAEERNRFAEMAFVCDLCARVLIPNCHSGARPQAENPESRLSKRSVAAVPIFRSVHLDSGFAAARRPGMTYDPVRLMRPTCLSSRLPIADCRFAENRLAEAAAQGVGFNTSS